MNGVSLLRWLSALSMDEIVECPRETHDDPLIAVRLSRLRPKEGINKTVQKKQDTKSRDSGAFFCSALRKLFIKGTILSRVSNRLGVFVS